MTRYRKYLVALIGAVLTWGLTAHLPDGSIDREEWWGLAVAAATALGVYQVANDPPAGEPGDPAVSERGASDLAIVLAAAIIGVALVLVFGTADN